jgi:thioredoxin reductase
MEVRDVQRGAASFERNLADGQRSSARKLLLATGVVDELPPIPGIAALWGTSVFPCPLCDAWELRGLTLGRLGRGAPALGLCRALTSWSRDLVLFSNGPLGLAAEDVGALHTLGVRLVGQGVLSLEAEHGRLARVWVAGRAPVACDGLFLAEGQHQRSPLVAKLGCTLLPNGTVEAGSYGATGVPGIYVAGDASEGVHSAIVAAAEGVQAAFAINRTFVRERFAVAARAATGPREPGSLDVPRADPG